MIDYKGREVLCSVRNMEVTFGKGRKAFVAVKGVNFRSEEHTSELQSRT